MSKFQILFRHPDANQPLEVEADHYNTNSEAAVFRRDVRDVGRTTTATVAYIPLHDVLAILTIDGAPSVP